MASSKQRSASHERLEIPFYLELCNNCQELANCNFGVDVHVAEYNNCSDYLSLNLKKRTTKTTLNSIISVSPYIRREGGLEMVKR